MTEMITRVAKAMAFVDKGGDYWDVMSEEGDGYGYVGKKEYLAMATAAIEAMRDATSEMYQAAFDIEEQRYAKHHPQEDMCAGDCWRAMIDKALQRS